VNLFDLAEPVISCCCCEHSEYRGQPAAAEMSDWHLIEDDEDAGLFPWTHVGVCPECWASGRWERYGD
jgi:hypothetical protein